MNAIFTTCTVNHLSRAFSLLSSVHEYHPDLKFFICLVDSVNPKSLPEGNYKVVFAEDMQLSFFNEMCIKYSTLELNSALKPYFGNFLLEQYSDIDKLVYLDSDILLFDKFDSIFDSLEEHSIIITPHSLSSIDSGLELGIDDRAFLRSGVYNAGFFAVRRDKEAIRFLDWWRKKLRNEGFFEPTKGMFAEQLWMNLIPLYFDNVLILLHKGCNMAYWNFHERAIVKRGDKFWVNDEVPLIFFHFSGAGLDCFEKDNPSKNQYGYKFTNRPDIIPVFECYLEKLQKYSLPQFDSLHTVTGKLRVRSRVLRSVIEFSRKVIKKLVYLK